MIGKTTGVEKRTSKGTFKPFCIRGHVRKENIDEAGHCLDCQEIWEKNKKDRRHIRMVTFKPFCKRGHARLHNVTTNGHCVMCRKLEMSPEYRREAGWKNYGIRNQDGNFFTFQDYNRCFQIQGGRCKGCLRHQSEFKKALCVDHNKKTGLFRGLLCSSCNVLLGHAKDRIETLKALIEYLRDNK